MNNLLKFPGIKLGLGLCMTGFLFCVDASASPIGSVLEVKGHAWLSPKKTPEKKLPLVARASFFDGDVLHTDANSQVTVILGSKEAALMIKSNSKIKVIHAQGKSWLLDMEMGQVISQVRTPSDKVRKKAPYFFKVKTPTAVMGVRGTTFFVKAEPGKDLFLCTCIGTVSVDDQLVITSKHHDAPKLIRPGKEALASRLTEVDMGTDHSDVEAGALIKLLE